MGQHRALYQIGGISPGQKNDYTTARPLAKARDFRSGSIASILACPRHVRLGRGISEMPVVRFCRRVATRYDKLATNYLAFIKLASIRIRLRASESAP
jgi:transposase